LATHFSPEETEHYAAQDHGDGLGEHADHLELVMEQEGVHEGVRPRDEKHHAPLQTVLLALGAEQLHDDVVGEAFPEDGREHHQVGHEGVLEDDGGVRGLHQFDAVDHSVAGVVAA